MAKEALGSAALSANRMLREYASRMYIAAVGILAKPKAQI